MNDDSERVIKSRHIKKANNIIRGLIVWNLSILSSPQQTVTCIYVPSYTAYI